MKTPDEIERLIDRALRQQPLRPAPRSLQARVLQEIARRKALPWWRQNFTYWPLAARITFCIASLGIVKAGLEVAMWLARSFEADVLAEQLPAQVAWIPSIFSAAGFVLRGLPSLWLYGTLGILALMYVVLFAVSAAAYRTVQPQHQGPSQVSAP
jgi:hypothetical protein